MTTSVERLVPVSLIIAPAVNVVTLPCRSAPTGLLTDGTVVCTIDDIARGPAIPFTGACKRKSEAHEDDEDAGAARGWANDACDWIGLTGSDW
jgi:hypothetical protein